MCMLRYEIENTKAKIVATPKVSIVSTPRGSNVFKNFFDEEQSKIFAEKIMAPMPMIVHAGPKEKSRHWDWKERKDFVIVEPEELIVLGRERLRAEKTLFDKCRHMSEVNWSSVYQGAFTTTIEETASEPLTGEHIIEAMEKLKVSVCKAGEATKEYGMAARKLPKRKQLRGDPRRQQYSARQFGNILLSMTIDILNNTTLLNALDSTKNTLEEVRQLIKPLFEEFIIAQGDKWQITGPMKLSAQEINTGKWKSVSALGGEILHYKGIDMGTRDGVCIIWETGNIIGMSEEMIINTTVKQYGDKITPAELSGNPANGPTFTDLLLAHAGKKDIVTAGEEIKAKIEIVRIEKIRVDLERKSIAYGEEFGLWG